MSDEPGALTERSDDKEALQCFFFRFLPSFLLSMSDSSALPQWWLACLQFMSSSVDFDKDNRNSGKVQLSMIILFFYSVISTRSLSYFEWTSRPTDGEVQSLEHVE